MVAGVLSFFIKKDGAPRNISLLSSILSLAIVIASLIFSGQQHSALNQVSYIWMPNLGSSFGFILDGLTKILCLLTAIVFPLVLLIINKDEYKKGIYDKTNDIINKSINNQLNEYKIKIFEHQQDINNNKLSSQEIGKRRNLIKKYEEKIEKLKNSNYNFDDLDIKLKINEQ